MRFQNYLNELGPLRRSMSDKGSGDADRNFRPGPSKCECGRSYVSKKGKKCIKCKREGK